MELLYTIANQVGAAIANAQMYEEARHKTEEIRKGVRRIARALGSSLDGRKTAQTIADLALEMTGADRSILLALDAQGNLVPRAASNFKSALSALPTVPASESGRGPETPTAFVARRCRSLTVEDFSLDLRFVLPSFAIRERITGYLGVPLKLGKDMLGVLEVYTREPRRFTPDEMRLMLTFASQASIGLQNALLVEQASRRLDDLEALGALASRLAQATPELLPDVLRLVGSAIRADAGVLRWFAPSSETHLYRRAEVLDVEQAEAIDTLLQDLATQVESSHQLSQLPSDPAVPALVVPVLSGETPRAVFIFVRAPQSHGFDRHERQFAETAANLLSARLH